MALEIHVLPLPHDLPALAWHWEAETDILGGSFAVPSTGVGFTGTVELNDEDGSIVVLDVVSGVLAGLDVVVWPEITHLPGLAVPVEARLGQVVIPSRSARRGASALEFDTTVSVAADPAEQIFHIRIGTRRAVEPVRVAEGFVVEVDASQRIAGFWLEGVPALPDAP
jgi:hypothetical protein